MLEAPCIHSAARQCVSSRVAQLNMNRERQLSELPSAFYHASNAHPAKRLSPLIEEDVVGLDAFLRVGPPQLAKRLMFVPLQVVAAIRTALEPADDDRSLRQVDIIPAEIAGFGQLGDRGGRSSGRPTNPGGHIGSV